MTVIYHEENGDLDFLAGKTIGVIGYGNLGRPVALNLRDSGLNVLVGLREDEQPIARADGFVAADIASVVQQEDGRGLSPAHLAAPSARAYAPFRQRLQRRLWVYRSAALC